MNKATKAMNVANISGVVLFLGVISFVAGFILSSVESVPTTNLAEIVTVIGAVTILMAVIALVVVGEQDVTQK